MFHSHPNAPPIPSAVDPEREIEERRTHSILGKIAVASSLGLCIIFLALWMAPRLDSNETGGPGGPPQTEAIRTLGANAASAAPSTWQPPASINPPELKNKTSPRVIIIISVVVGVAVIVIAVVVSLLFLLQDGKEEAAPVQDDLPSPVPGNGSSSLPSGGGAAENNDAPTEISNWVPIVLGFVGVVALAAIAVAIAVFTMRKNPKTPNDSLENTVNIDTTIANSIGSFEKVSLDEKEPSSSTDSEESESRNDQPEISKSESATPIPTERNDDQAQSLESSSQSSAIPIVRPFMSPLDLVRVKLALLQSTDT